MQIVNNLHAFIWKSMSANNCNTYLIDGPTRILIDPDPSAFTTFGSGCGTKLSGYQRTCGHQRATIQRWLADGA